jgi:uncharacterized protein (DUF169 family)
MMDLQALERTLTGSLDLSTRPVAIAFRDRPPRGVARATPDPAGCGYWRAAAEGGVFYTEAADHHACPVGAYVHHVELPADALEKLDELTRTMVGLEYITADEIARLPRLEREFRFAVYAPLAAAPVAPDVALVRGNARQMMLLSEAAQSAGAGSELPAMGRPTCAVIPAALRSGRMAASFGCVGNRIYTGTREDQAWAAIPGASLGILASRLQAIVRANRVLEEYHRSRIG